MTLQDLANRIDRNGSARVDYVVTDVLKHEILPRFFGDIDSAVGDVFWRRTANGTFETVVGLHRYPLPRNFKVMGSVGVGNRSDGRYCQLEYIGNDAHRMRRYAALQSSSDPIYGDYGGYWIEMPVQPAETNDPLLYQYELVLGSKPDQVYTVDYVYYTTPDLRGSDVNVELDQFIPFEYQHALIALCRADLLADRHGGEDPAVVHQFGIYTNWLTGLKSKKNSGRNPIPKFAW